MITVPGVDGSPPFELSSCANVDSQDSVPHQLSGDDLHVSLSMPSTLDSFSATVQSRSLDKFSKEGGNFVITAPGVDGSPPFELSSCANVDSQDSVPHQLLGDVLPLSEHSLQAVSAIPHSHALSTHTIPVTALKKTSIYTDFSRTTRRQISLLKAGDDPNQLKITSFFHLLDRVEKLLEMNLDMKETLQALERQGKSHTMQFTLILKRVD